MKQTFDVMTSGYATGYGKFSGSSGDPRTPRKELQSFGTWPENAKRATSNGRGPCGAYSTDLNADPEALETDSEALEHQFRTHLNRRGGAVGAKKAEWLVRNGKSRRAPAEGCDDGGMSERLTMRKIREILRLADECGRSQREIASSLSGSRSARSAAICRRPRGGLRGRGAGADGQRGGGMLFRMGAERREASAPIDYAHVHHELHKRRRRCTCSGPSIKKRWLLAARLKPYQYSQFCELYGAWRHGSSRRCSSASRG